MWDVDNKSTIQEGVTCRQTSDVPFHHMQTASLTVSSSDTKTASTSTTPITRTRTASGSVSYNPTITCTSSGSLGVADLATTGSRFSSVTTSQPVLTLSQDHHFRG
eukprot:gb/GECG01010009.1/.p1 GENE.gb/GECG01010009.1/~~gb/GECG01010009.1/.p1  ORF type:complete len:106 (+),score=2.22 gb/GECG01010009.1/:1-318(+)